MQLAVGVRQSIGRLGDARRGDERRHHAACLSEAALRRPLDVRDAVEIGPRRDAEGEALVVIAGREPELRAKSEERRVLGQRHRADGRHVRPSIRRIRPVHAERYAVDDLEQRGASRRDARHPEGGRVELCRARQRAHAERRPLDFTFEVQRALAGAATIPRDGLWRRRRRLEYQIHRARRAPDQRRRDDDERCDTKRFMAAAAAGKPSSCQLRHAQVRAKRARAPWRRGHGVGAGCTHRLTPRRRSISSSDARARTPPALFVVRLSRAGERTSVSRVRRAPSNGRRRRRAEHRGDAPRPRCDRAPVVHRVLERHDARAHAHVDERRRRWPGRRSAVDQLGVAGVDDLLTLYPQQQAAYGPPPTTSVGACTVGHQQARRREAAAAAPHSAAASAR